MLALVQSQFKKTCSAGNIRRASSIASQFQQCKKGSVIVEYALTAMIFCSLLLVIIDIALLSFAESLIGKGIMATARKAQIGEYAGITDGPAQFRANLCEETLGLFDCDAFHIVVRVGNSFTAARNVAVSDPKELYNGRQSFDFGDPEEIVLLSVIYPWSTIIINPELAGRIRNDGDSLLTTTAVIRNEPADPS